MNLLKNKIPVGIIAISTLGLVAFSTIKEDYFEITKQIESELKSYTFPKTVSYSFSGVQEEQGKNQNFLMYALFLALAGITIIIVLQFNSVSKTMVILF